MNYEIHNLTPRLVSIHCNSGKTCHLPPGYKLELPEQEIAKNVMVEKLKNKKRISVSKATASKAGKSLTANTNTEKTSETTAGKQPSDTSSKKGKAKTDKS